MLGTFDKQGIRGKEVKMPRVDVFGNLQTSTGIGPMGPHMQHFQGDQPAEPYSGAFEPPPKEIIEPAYNGISPPPNYGNRNPFSSHLATDRAVHNSPPPMDDVGGLEKEVFDPFDPDLADLFKSAHEIIDKREKTHGDFRENGRVMQGMKDFARSGPQWDNLSDYQKEAVEMILHKVGRIVCGDAMFDDHWADIAGYAEKVRQVNASS